MSPTAFLTKFFLLILCGGVSYLLYKHFIVTKKKHEVIKLRKASTPQRPSSNIRATDLQKLKPQDMAKLERARKLVEQGQTQEGAQLFEEINLHRYAVSALEDVGMLEEACAVLMRLQRPNRAGSLMAKHSQHVRSAEFYLLANMHEEAAQQFAEAGEQNPSCYTKAGKIFEKINMPEKALEAYARGSMAEKVVELAFRCGAWDALVNFLADSKNIAPSFACMGKGQIKKIVLELPINKRNIHSFASWANVSGKKSLVGAILRKLIDSRDDLALFWSLLSLDFANTIVSAIIETTRSMGPEGLNFLGKNAWALFDTHRYDLAGKLYAAAGRYAMAAKCAALTGDLDQCLTYLRQADENSILEQCERVLECSDFPTQKIKDPKSGKEVWHPEMVKACCRILDPIDPHGDDVRFASPFSLVGH